MGFSFWCQSRELLWIRRESMNLNLHPRALVSPVPLFLIAWQGLLPSLCPERQECLREKLNDICMKNTSQPPRPRATSNTADSLGKLLFTFLPPSYKLQSGRCYEHFNRKHTKQALSHHKPKQWSKPHLRVSSMSFSISEFMREGIAWKSAGQGQAANAWAGVGGWWGGCSLTFILKCTTLLM